MELCKDGILSNEEFINLTMSSQDTAMALLWKEFRGDATMRKEAEQKLRERMEDIAGQRKKDNTIKDQGREQAITNALAVVPYTVVDG